jgi:hypothetical protein
MDENQILSEFREYIRRESEKVDPDGRLYLNPHLLDTEKRLLELRQDPNCGLRIAALGHDIDRIFQERASKGDFPSYEAYKLEHSIRSAKKTAEFLRQHTQDNPFLAYVYELIIYHDIKGVYPEAATPQLKEDVDLVRDSDSISFFHINLENYFKDYSPEDFENKIKFMHSKISAERKDIVNRLLRDNQSKGEVFARALAFLKTLSQS